MSSSVRGDYFRKSTLLLNKLKGPVSKVFNFDGEFITVFSTTNRRHQWNTQFQGIDSKSHQITATTRNRREVSILKGGKVIREAVDLVVIKNRADSKV